MARQPDLITDVRGFMKSRVILSAAALDFFTKLDGNDLSAEELADMLGLNPRATTRILDCLITFDLLEKKNGRYRTTEEGAPLSARHPQSILPAVNHMNTIWDNWSRLTEAVIKGANPHLKPVVDAWSKEDRKAFIGAMHVAAASLSEEIADTYDAGRFKRLLDVGGGSGAYTIAFLKKNPHLRALIFDLAEVVPIAEEKIRQQGLADRVTIVAGDFYKDQLPAGCDLALLSAVIHQNSPDQNVALFRKIHDALNSGGALLIRDHVMDEARTEPPAGALFALNMLVNTPGGDTYTFGEVNDMLTRAGFSGVKLIRAGKKMDCLVEASK
jgi:SAM-dependent methyltransferase